MRSPRAHDGRTVRVLARTLRRWWNGEGWAPWQPGRGQLHWHSPSSSLLPVGSWRARVLMPCTRSVSRVTEQSQKQTPFLTKDWCLFQYTLFSSANESAVPWNTYFLLHFIKKKLWSWEPLICSKECHEPRVSGNEMGQAGEISWDQRVRPTAEEGTWLKFWNPQVIFL